MWSHKKLPKILYALASAARNELSFGLCPVCDLKTVFISVGSWHREDLKCLRCGSSARHRALIHYLKANFANLHSHTIYELSPYGAVSRKLEKSGSKYFCSHYFPESAEATYRNYRNENVEKLTFADDQFDLVITQDVFEHVGDPAKGFAEIARVLVDGGSHIFTIPWCPTRPTERRAVIKGETVKHLKPPQYHGDPVNDRGALVVTDFGQDLVDLIKINSGMDTRITALNNNYFGIKGDITIFHSVKRG